MVQRDRPREHCRRAPATPEDWSQASPPSSKGICEDQSLQGWTEDRWTELRATYYGMCARLDHQFGLLMDALKETGLYDDTAVFLFSDHGDYTGDYGIVEKTQNTFEDCLDARALHRQAARRRCPSSPASATRWSNWSTSPPPSTTWPASTPAMITSARSLLPVLAGRTDEHRDAVFCEGGRRYGEVQAMERESTSSKGKGLYSPRILLQITDDGPYHTKAAMCRTQTHKYVHRLYEQDELYDLVADPLEETNIVDDSACQGILMALKERLLRWYMETCDVVPRTTDRR